MKDVKHLACVWHWCGINLDWVYSLNHCTSSSFVAQELPRFLGKSFISRGFWNVVMRHPYAHPLHMNVVKHLACVWHWYEINLDWVLSLNHCTSPSFVAQELPRFLPKALSEGAGAAGMLLGCIHMHIHRKWWLSNTLHVSDIDMGSILIESTASITALHHHLLPRSYPDF